MAWRKYIATLHPFLFGLFPVTFLYARNVTEVRLGEIYLPIALIMGALLVGWLLLSLMIRDVHQRALVLSSFILLFFLNGSLVSLLAEIESLEGATVFTAERIVPGVLLLLLIAVVILILRSHSDLARMSRLIAQVALSLLVIQVAVAVYSGTKVGEAVTDNQESSALERIGRTSPDVYYLILDGYARSDVLRDLYNFDNRYFLEALTSRGFYVTDSSFSNYNSTAQSLSSSLNMNYLHRIMPTDRGEFSRLPTAMMLENNRVMSYLRRYGYNTVSFSTGYAPTEIEYGDYYFSPGWTLSEFQNHLLNATPLPLLMSGLKSQHDFHRDQVNFALTKLGDLGEVPSPKFVFAHISCPHPPFVFGPDGESVGDDRPFSISDGDHFFRRDTDRATYLEGYRDQVTYISGRIIETIDSIMADAPQPPVIIVQADHGPGSGLHWESLAQTNLRERFSILNAYFLPGVDPTVFYPGISPINSFRIVLNHYFGTEFERLPDHSYFTTWSQPYNYQLVTDSLAGR